MRPLLVSLIHQNHGHDHVKQATGTKWEGPEADANQALIGSDELLFTLSDATHRLTPRRIERNWGRSGLERRMQTELMLGPPPLRRAVRLLRKTLRAWTRPGGGSRLRR